MAVWKPLVLLVVIHNTGGLLGAEVRSCIISGNNAAKGRWPWMVHLNISTDDGLQKWRCGGTILNNYWVLTAGRCWDDQLGSRWNRVGVWIGTHELQKPSEHYMSVRNVIRHPEFGPLGHGYINDISLVWLKKKISFSKRVAPVSLPSASDTFSSSSECWITGWGEIRTGGGHMFVLMRNSGEYQLILDAYAILLSPLPLFVPLPDPEILQQLQITVLPESECRLTYPVLTNNMLCAGDPAGGKDACNGNYGDPLVCRTASGFVQVGIMSFGSPDGCGIRGQPGVYTQVSKYLSFINDYIN